MGSTVQAAMSAAGRAHAAKRFAAEFLRLNADAPWLKRAVEGLPVQGEGEAVATFGPKVSVGLLLRTAMSRAEVLTATEEAAWERVAAWARSMLQGRDEAPRVLVDFVTLWLWDSDRQVH